MKNPQAFPQYSVNPFGVAEIQGGMTLRDHFAGLAMQALIMKNDHIRDDEEISNEAFELADTMLLRREE
jgi:hypothetical protein